VRPWPGWPATPTVTRTAAAHPARSRRPPPGRKPRGTIWAGRARPKLWGQAYFGLGDPDRGSAYLRDYYAFTGPFAETIAAANLTSARAIRDLIRGYRAEGCDELVLLPTVSDPAEVERLAEVVA